MWKKKALANSRYRYTLPAYKSVSYTTGGVTIKLDDFLNDLHTTQLDMIEEVVAIKEQEGFPEATVLIKHIMGLK